MEEVTGSSSLDSGSLLDRAGVFEPNHCHFSVVKRCLYCILNCLLLLLPTIASLAIDRDYRFSLIVGRETVSKVLDQTCKPGLEGHKSIVVVVC